MTTTIDTDVLCFEVERALAKALSMRCETFICGPTEWRIRVGLRWNLRLEREQLEDLHNYIDSASALKDRFDQLAPDCLAFQRTP